jgi:hypothetical protein
MEKADGPWTLPEDLATLHNVIIHYGVHVQKASAAQHEKTGNGPLSHIALSHLRKRSLLAVLCRRMELLEALLF